MLDNIVRFEVYVFVYNDTIVCLFIVVYRFKSLSILLNNHLNGDVNNTSEVLQIQILMLSANKYHQWCLSFYMKISW